MIVGFLGVLFLAAAPPKQQIRLCPHISSSYLSLPSSPSETNLLLLEQHHLLFVDVVWIVRLQEFRQASVFHKLRDDIDLRLSWMLIEPYYIINSNNLFIMLCNIYIILYYIYLLYWYNNSTIIYYYLFIYLFNLIFSPSLFLSFLSSHLSLTFSPLFRLSSPYRKILLY